MKKVKVFLSTAMLLAGAVVVMLPVQACSEDESEESSPTGTINGHEYVDLGLSVKWATCNVGADEPWEYGNYYAWGETETKSSYTEENSKTYGRSMGDIAGNPYYDVARAMWGAPWRLPTKDEINELVDNCTRKWTTLNGVNGCEVTGPNGKSIFLPMAGSFNGTTLNGVGECGCCWSSSPYEGGTRHACYLDFYSGNFYLINTYRYFGQSVRPVSE